MRIVLNHFARELVLGIDSQIYKSNEKNQKRDDLKTKWSQEIEHVTVWFFDSKNRK